MVRIKQLSGNWEDVKHWNREEAALKRKESFLIVPNLATNVSLKTGFIGRLDEKIGSKAGFFTPTSLRPVVIVNETRRYDVLNIESYNSVGQPARLAAE